MRRIKQSLREGRAGWIILWLLGVPIPVLLAKPNSYEVASKVHDLTVKTRPNDVEKISLIRDLIAANVDLEKILNSLQTSPKTP